MSESLYRKHRPQQFADIIGQSNAVTQLSNYCSNRNLPHALLLSGTRGVGKTTLARIVATNWGLDPIDVYEIDAASQRGIDEIRQLREDVKTVPVASTHKMYILDEAHMITGQAWNAFLKTLEEPPAHALFILATTDPEKIPDTILSRVTTLRLQEPKLTDITALLSRVCIAESVSVDADALELLSLYADGSFRNALVALEQVITQSPHHIDAVSVESILSLPSVLSARELLQALSIKDSDAIIHWLSERSITKPDFFVGLLIDRVRMVLAIRFRIVMHIPSSDKLLVDSIAVDRNSPVNSAFLVSLINLARDMKQNSYSYELLQCFIYGQLEQVSLT